MDGSSRLYPASYYESTRANTIKKKDRWFCNRPLSPISNTENFTPNEKQLQNTNNTNLTTPETCSIQEQVVTSSFPDDDLNSTTIHHIPGKSSDELFSDNNSVIDDSDVDPDYNPVFDSLSDELEDFGEVLSTEVDNTRISRNNNIPSNCTLNNSDSTSNVNRKTKNRNFCYYCESEVLNFARHVFRNHSSEIEVQKISFPKNSKNRKHWLCTLRKKGNYLNINEKEKPLRKCVEERTYLPCIHCLGFYSSKNLWRHRKHCVENPSKGASSAGSQTAAHDLLTRHLKIDAALRDRVFPRMRGDKISLTAKKVVLICSFGARYIKTHREKHFESVASRKMRELARLLLELKKLQPSIRNLFDALKPQNYDLLVTSTKNLAGYDPENETYKSPTFAINTGTTLKQCCDIAILYVLKRSNIDETILAANAEADFKTLIQLIDSHWRYDVSSVACGDLNTKKWNKVAIVPLASDLKMLKDYLIRKANDAVLILEKNNNDQQAFTQLLDTVFCRVILLNRKRPGELQRLLLHTYEKCKDVDNPQGYEEFSEVVSETEKILMKSFKRIVIRGKRGRGVPVLFTKDVQEHLNVILKYRPAIIKKPNIYLFGNPNTSEPIVGYKILKKYAIACGAKNPESITCTRLRKHLATLTQLFNMSENDLEQLASFMGHTLGVHRSSYRLPDDVYQTAKISKLLLLMEKGKAGEFKGRCLDDINIDLEENLLDNIEECTEDVETRMQEKMNEIEEEKENEIPENIDGVQRKHSRQYLEEKLASTNSKPNMAKRSKRTLVPWTNE